MPNCLCFLRNIPRKEVPLVFFNHVLLHLGELAPEGHIGKTQLPLLLWASLRGKRFFYLSEPHRSQTGWTFTKGRFPRGTILLPLLTTTTRERFIYFYEPYYSRAWWTYVRGRSDVIPLAQYEWFLTFLGIILSWIWDRHFKIELDQCSIIKNSPKLVPKPKLIWKFHVLSNWTD